MLLIIHNLPKMMRYEEVKALIKEKCHLTNIIVDNLVLETTLTRKVTIGLSDDNDAAIVFKELNGLVLGGRKIVVEDPRKNKDSGMRFQSPVAQDNNMMPNNISLQYATYSQSQGGNYCLSNMTAMQNTQMQYPPAPCPPVYSNMQQQNLGTAAPDFIPFAGEKSKDDFYGQSDRYFSWNDNSEHNAPDMRGGLTSYTKDGNFSNDWSLNRSDDYKGRFGSGNESGGTGRDSGRWGRGNGRDDRNRGAEKSGSRRFGNTFEPRYDVRPARNDPKYERAPERPKGDRFERPSARSDYGSRYSEQGRQRQKEHAAPVRGYQNRPEQKADYKQSKFPNIKIPKNEVPRGQPHISRRGNLVQSQSNSAPPRVQTKPDSAEALKNKNETWRGQAVSAIVKDLLAENGMNDLVKKHFFLTYVKPILRSKIDAMLGKRKVVPLPQIIEEYKRKTSAAAQRAFIINERKNYERSRLEMGEITKEEYEATACQLDAHLKSLKRPASGPPQGNASKKLKKNNQPPKTMPKAAAAQRPKTLPPADVLPKYPNNDKMEYKKLKRLEKSEQDVYVHRLDVELKKALDKEVDILCDLFREECQKVTDKDEQSVCSRLMNTVEAFKTVIHLNVSKRLLNITRNLPLRVFTERKVNSKEIKEKLKSLGIVTFRKSMGKNKYIATCRSYDQYDNLCNQETFVIDGERFVFRPMHLVIARKYRQKDNAKGNRNDTSVGEEGGDADDNDDVEFGDEEGGGEDFDFDEEEDNTGDELFDGEEQKYDKKDVKIIESSDATNADGNKTEVAAVIPETEAATKVKVEADGNTIRDVAESSSTEVAIAETADTVNETQKIEQPSNEMKNAETEELIKDIQALSDSINGGQNVNKDLSENKAATSGQGNDNIVENDEMLDMAEKADQHIDQADLEDF